MARIRSELTINNFQTEIERMFQGSQLGLRFDQLEDNILRVGFYRGRQELVLDLRAGPSTRFGRTIFEAVSTGEEEWQYAFGAEVLGVGEKQRFLSSEASFINYVKGSFLPLPGVRGRTPRERYLELRTFGYMPTAEEGYMAAGGVQNISATTHFDRQIIDLLESVTIRTAKREDIDTAIDQLLKAGTEERRFLAMGISSTRAAAKYIAEMPAFMQVPVASRERGRIVPIPGTIRFTEDGKAIIGGMGPAETVAKREALMQREENVQFIERTTEGRLRIAEPGYITERGAMGWRYPNLMAGGEMPPAMFFIPRTLQLPGGTPSGTIGLRKEVWESYNSTTDMASARNVILSASYRRGVRVDFPEVNPQEVTGIQITPGMYIETAGGAYERMSGYGERAIPAGETGIVGLMRWEVQELGTEGKFVTREVTKPIRVTAGPTPFYIPEGKEFGLHLYLPPYYSTKTGKPAKFPGHGIASTAQVEQLMMAGATQPGLQIHRNATGDIVLKVLGMQASGFAPKSFTGEKGAFTPIAQPYGAAAPTITIPGTGAIEQYWAVTSDIKLATQQFQWAVFGGLPNVQQEQMLRELENANKALGPMVNEMIEYLRGNRRDEQPMIRGGTRLPDIDVLGKIYAQYTGTPAAGAGFNLMEQLRIAVLKLKPNVSMERYGVALLPEAWHTIGYVHEGQVPIEEEAYQNAFGPNWRKYGRLTPVPGTQLYQEELYSYGMIAPSASTLVAEYRSGEELANRAAVRSVAALIGEELGIGPGISPMKNMPPAARAWSGMVDVVSWWKEKMRPLPAYGMANQLYPQPFKTTTLAEVAATGIGGWLTKNVTPRQINEFLQEKMGGVPEMIIGPSGEIFPGSRLIDPLATYKFDLDVGAEAVLARLAKRYPEALKAFIEYGTLRPGPEGPTPASEYMDYLSEYLITPSKDIAKTTTASRPEFGAGGRYLYTSGPPVTVGIISEEVLRTSIMKKARTIEGIGDKRKWYKMVTEQIKQMGGIPSMNVREPNVWEGFGAVPLMLVTPTILQEQYGLEYPEGTRIWGMKKQHIIPGSPFFTGVLGAFGVATIGQQGDWDFDQMLSIFGIEITKEGITATKGVLAASKKTPQAMADMLKQSIDQAVGKERAGDFNIVEKSLRDMASYNEETGRVTLGDLPGMREGKPVETAEAEGLAVQQVAHLRKISKTGMGIAHNMRTWMTAGGTALGMSNDVIRKGVIGSAYPYQQYLDYAIKEIEVRGGFTALEELFSTSVLSYQKQTGELSIYGKTAGDRPWGRVMSTYARQDVSGRVVPSNTSYYGMVETLTWALQESGFTAQTIGFLLGQTPEMRKEITEAITPKEWQGKGISLTNIMLGGINSIWERGGYDITKTPIGVAYMTSVLRRGLKQQAEAEIIEVAAEGGGTVKVPVLQAGAAVPMWWQGKTVALGELQHDVTFQATNIIFQALTGQGGPITPSEAFKIHALIDQIRATGMEPPMELLQIAARFPVQEAVQDALSRRLSDEQVTSEYTNRVIGTARSKPLSVRASSIPWLALSYEDAGAVYGTGLAGKESWAKFGEENRLALFMQKVLGLKQTTVSKVFPREPIEIRRMEAGKRFELEYVAKHHAEWSRNKRSVLSNIDWETGTPTVTIGQLAKWGPTSDVFEDLLRKYPELEEWGITGIPDVIRVGENKEAIIEEVKQMDFFYGKKYQEMYAKYGGNIPPDVRRALEEEQMALKTQSKQVRVQLATYMLSGLASAAGGAGTFGKWINPLIRGSAEYRAILNDPDLDEFERERKAKNFMNRTRTNLFRAFQQGLQGLEIAHIRNSKFSDPAQMTLNETDLVGLATFITKGVEEAYITWTDPAKAKQLLLTSVGLIQAAGLDLEAEAPELAAMIERYPRQPAMPRKVKQTISRTAVPVGARGRGGAGGPVDIPPEMLDPNGLMSWLMGEFKVSFLSTSSPEWVNQAVAQKTISQYQRLQSLTEGTGQVGSFRQQVALALSGKWSGADLSGIDPLQLAREVRARSPAEFTARMAGAGLLGLTTEYAKAFPQLKAGAQAAARGANVSPTERADLIDAPEGRGAYGEMGLGIKLANELKPFMTSTKEAGEIIKGMNKQFVDLGTQIDTLTKQAVTYQQTMAKYEPGEPEYQAAAKGLATTDLSIKLAAVQKQRVGISAAREILAAGGTIPGVTAEGLATKEETLRGQEEALQGGVAAQQAGVPFGAGLSRTLRRFIGGFGLFYLGALASWPARAMGYGLQQQEEFAAAGAQYAGGYIGAGEVSPYQALSYDVQRAQISANASGLAQWQRMQANIPGVFRQLGGVAMGGIAGAAFANYALSSAAGWLGQGTVAAIGGPVTAIGAALGVAAGTSLNILSNAAYPQQAAASAAADLTRYGSTVGALSNWWNVTLPHAAKQPVSKLEMLSLDQYLSDPTGYIKAYNLSPEAQAKYATDASKLEAWRNQQITGFPYQIAQGGMTTLARQMMGERETGTPAERAAIRNIYEMAQRQGRVPYAEQMPFVAQQLAVQPEFAAYAPELVQQTGIRMFAGGQAFQPGYQANMLKLLQAQSVGINTQEMSALYNRVMRQVYTGQTGMAGELWVAQNVQDVYQQQTYAQAWQWMAQAPATYVQQTLGTGLLPQTQAAAQLMISPSAGVWEAGANLANQAQNYGYQWTAPTVSPTATANQRYEAMSQIARGQAAVNVKQQLATWGYAGMGTRPGVSPTAILDRGRGRGGLTNYSNLAEYISNIAEQGAVGQQQTARILSTMDAFAQVGIAPTSVISVKEQADFYGTIRGAQLGQLQAQIGGTLQTGLGQQAGMDLLNQISAPGGIASTLYGAQQLAGMVNLNPVNLTQAAMALPTNAFGTQFSQIFARSDISLSGRPTGLTYGTTGLQRGNIPGVDIAAQIWGPNWQQSPTARAMTLGYTAPSGEVVGGTRGAQWQQMQLSYEAQMASIGANVAQINLSQQYAPQFYALQTQQAQLGYRQQMANFAYQEAAFNINQQQFALQGQQFNEQMGLQQRQMGMQRGWTREDWAYQQNVRQLQWGWRQEDFQENVRFMTGRERRLSERQMGRETTLYGMETEQIDKQKKRQEEIWKLEDERFNLQKRQFEEGRRLQQESYDLQKKQMDLQKKFYQEGFELQEKYRKLQYDYQMQQLDISLQAAGAQATYAQAAYEANVAMKEYYDWLEDQEGKYQLMISSAGAVTAAIGTAIQTLQDQTQKWYDKVKKWWTTEDKFVQDQTGAVRTIPPGYPNDSYTMHVSTGETVYVIPEDKGIRTNGNWGSIVGNYAMQGSSPTGGGIPMTLIINIGNERLGRFVVSKISQELEVH